MLCPVCNGKFRHLRRHAVVHLPWFWYPATCCQDCKTQHLYEDVLDKHMMEYHQEERAKDWDASYLNSLITTYLLALGNKLGFDTLTEICNSLDLDYNFKITCTRKELVDSDLDLCRALDTTLHSTSNFTLLDPSGHLTLFSLVHWRTILHHLVKLTEEDRSSLEQKAQTVLEAQEDPEVQEAPRMEIADAHLHFDHVLNHVSDPDLQKLDQHGAEQQFNTNLTVMIANYCFPTEWPKKVD